MAEKVVKQYVFSWEGTDRHGKKLKGEIRGPNLNLVKADLRRQGVTPIKVRRRSNSTLFAPRKKKITTKDITVFSRQLSTMISSGIPLVQAMEIMGKGHENPAMQEIILTLKTDIEGGASLSQAMRKHPRQFDGLYCNLVRAGEQAGILENLMNKIATYKEKTETMKSKIRRALFYPVAVLAVAAIITYILLVFVVPQFETLYSGLGADLPVPTQIVISMSVFLQSYGWIVILMVVGGIYMFIKVKRTSESLQTRYDALVLKLPVVGAIVRKATIARYARTLGTMFAAGVPLVEALESVSGATGNNVYRDAIVTMRGDVATGQQLQLAMQQSKLFPNMAVQMVAIGEESGSLDGMLSKIADFYEQEVDEAVEGMSSLMEPVIMVVLGTVIGSLVVAMYLPIFKMGQIL